MCDPYSSDSSGFEMFADGRLACSRHHLVVCSRCGVDFSHVPRRELSEDSDDDESEADEDPGYDAFQRETDELYNQLSPERRAEIDARWGPPPSTHSNARTRTAANRVEVTENPSPAAEVRRGTGPVLPSKFVPPSAASTPDSLFPFGLGLQVVPPVARFVRHDDPEQILVYTDGACLNNGQANPKAGWACVIRPEFMRPAGIISGRLENKGPSGESHNQTRNRAELRAVLGAVHFQNWLAEGFTKLVIATDSEYVVKGATEWVRAWVRKGWKTRVGADVKNKDLWETLLEQVKRWHDMGLTIQFWRIPRELNTEADRAAKSAAGSDEVPDQYRFVPGPDD